MALSFERGKSLFTKLKFVYIVTLTEPTTPLYNAHQGGSFFVHFQKIKTRQSRFYSITLVYRLPELGFPLRSKNNGNILRMIEANVANHSAHW